MASQSKQPVHTHQGMKQHSMLNKQLWNWHCIYTQNSCVNIVYNFLITERCMKATLLLFPILNGWGWGKTHELSQKFLQDHPKHILVESYKHNYSRHKFKNDLQLNLNEEEASSNLYLFHHPWISGLAFYSRVYSAAPGGRSFSLHTQCRGQSFGQT